jgi:hypothetical protein
MFLRKYSDNNLGLGGQLSLINFKDGPRAVCYYCGNSIYKDFKKYGSSREKLYKDENSIIDEYRNHDKFCVQWHGYGEVIYLHPHCAEEIALHLIKDIRSGESSNYER